MSVTINIDCETSQIEDNISPPNIQEDKISKVKENKNNFDNDNDYQVIYDSFIKKFKSHFSSPTAEINAFLNNFEKLLLQHVVKEDKNEADKAVKEKKAEEFGVYVLCKILYDLKLIDCPLLEKGDIRDAKTLSEIKKLATVVFKIQEEYKSHLSQSTKTRATRDTNNTKLTINSQDTKSMHSSQLTKSSKGTNGTKSTLDTMPSTVSSTLVVTSEDFDSYCEIIPKAIHKTVVHIKKTKEKVDKTKSLVNIIKNILKNMSQSKTFPRNLSDIIDKDGNCGVMVMNMMAKLGIIEIVQDNKHIKLVEHKLADFEVKQYDEKWLKEKVREEMVKANNK